MEVLCEKEIPKRFKKECFCSKCGSRLMVLLTDLDLYYQYKCPVCGFRNDWLTPEEQKQLALIREALEKDREFLLQNTPKRISQYWHSTENVYNLMKSKIIQEA